MHVGGLRAVLTVARVNLHWSDVPVLRALDELREALGITVERPGMENRGSAFLTYTQRNLRLRHERFLYVF